ncbi:MAG TPA: amylo-alpha-1,6-glucosidase [Noviherbaspirillum sp.]|nr:amylo-alpha-1,6-glucosidase [Noviherbaspirillum sp.]
MVEKVQVGEQWYILATASPADERRRVLKHDNTFAMFDRFGDIQSIGLGEEGMYLGDTCFLSHHELLIEGVRPMYLNSTVKDDNGLFIIELMNPDLHPEGRNRVPKGEMHVFRAKLLWNNSCYEHVRVVNFGLDLVETTLSMEFEADYKDIFEVRGFERKKRGEYMQPRISQNELLLGYKGVDGNIRKTRITCNPAPAKIDGRRIDYRITLPPKGEAHVYVTISCEDEELAAPRPTDYFEAFTQVSQATGTRLQKRCKVSSSDPLFNRWLDRSTADLVMLTTSLPDGDYPFAGLPWYSTTFGRDGILTAHEYLWVDPAMAKGVLAFLAATQATEMDPERDAEPGKILHEARRGELAELNEIPFRRYYGTVDATPLFVGLAGAYYARTGDLDFIRSIWDNIRNALHWIDHYGDRDGDGFVEYARYTESGLVQQGWKDSYDSVFHRDGRLADAPIALCEVQGYVYDAKLRAAELASLLGEVRLAMELEESAMRLKERFNRVFWCEEIGTYALALDGHKKQCRVASSNAGHALWSGIATPEYAERVAEQLLSDDFFCGWGIRTIPVKEARYNPMAYHNGSVWPHDNAIIAEGMARYGFTGKAMQVFSALREASLYMDQNRMPELFCGFDRRPDEGPTLYPVACSPQAWAAACVFSLLQACLGLSFNPQKSEVRFRHPQLPPFLDKIEIHDLLINGATLDLMLQRYPNNVGVNVVRKEGNAEVVAVA